MFLFYKTRDVQVADMNKQIFHRNVRRHLKEWRAIYFRLKPQTNCLEKPTA